MTSGGVVGLDVTRSSVYALGCVVDGGRVVVLNPLILIVCVSGGGRG